MKNSRIIIRGFSATLVFVFLSLLIFAHISAAELVNRSVLLSSSFPSENVTHTFSFNTISSANVGSIAFLYCSNSPLSIDPCVAPVGLDVSSAGIFSQNGITGFSVSGVTSSNNLVISRAPAAELPVSASYVFSNIINPSTSNETDYVRIALYDGIDGTGSVIDSGAVAFVVDDRYDIAAYVPPYLTFCAAVTVQLDCSSVAGFLVDFGEFSAFSTSAVTSQFSVATNDPTGYNTFLNGQTMLSGSNAIPALTTQSSSQPGVSQFGINLRANSSPSVGANLDSGPVASGVVSPTYNTPNQFKFVPGDKIAGSTLSTGFNRYTVSYIVNVSQNQKPGIYATTLTYTSVASF